MKFIVPTRNSYSARENFFNSFDNVFNDFFETPLQQGYSLDCDVQESDKYILMTFDLPGFEEKNINIEVKKSQLLISGERKREEHESLKSRYQGRSYGSFLKRFDLPESIDGENIEADYTQGVLKLLLPKKEDEQPKKIEVQSKKGNLLSQLFSGKESA